MQKQSFNNILKNLQLPKNNHSIISCTSSNPGHPDSDKKQLPKNNHAIISCTSSNPGHPDSDKKQLPIAHSDII